MAELMVWRKSMKKTGCCPACKCKIFDPKTGEPTENCTVDESKKNDTEVNLFCGNCFRNNKLMVVGTSRTVSEGLAECFGMYKGINWSKAEKSVANDVNKLSQCQTRIAELEQKIRQLEFQNGMLQGNMTHLKTRHDKTVELLRKENERLTKEMKDWEHAYKRLHETVYGGDI